MRFGFTGAPAWLWFAGAAIVLAFCIAGVLTC